MTGIRRAERGMSAWAGRSALVAALLALGSMGGCVQVGIEIEELRRKLSPEELQFADDSARAGEHISESRRFEARLDPELLRYVALAEVTSMRFVPTGAASDLSFVQHVRVAFVGEGELPTAVLAEIGAEDAHEAPGALELRINEELDATAYLKANRPFELEVELDLPRGAWGIDVEMALDLSLEHQVKLF